jgi:hypothetical protein
MGTKIPKVPIEVGVIGEAKHRIMHERRDKSIVKVLIGGGGSGVEGTDPTFVDGWDGITREGWGG